MDQWPGTMEDGKNYTHLDRRRHAGCVSVQRVAALFSCQRYGFESLDDRSFIFYIAVSDQNNKVIDGVDRITNVGHYLGSIGGGLVESCKANKLVADCVRQSSRSGVGVAQVMRRSPW